MMTRKERLCRAKQMRQEYEAGCTTQEIADDWGFSPEGVRAAIVRAGGKMRPVGHGSRPAEIDTLDEEAKAAVLADCELHLTAAEIADRHGLRVCTVRSICGRRLNPKRIRGEERTRQTLACKELFDRGYGYSLIGRKLGMPHMRVKRLLVEAGIRTRPTGCRFELERVRGG